MPRATLTTLASPLLSLLVYSIGHGLLTTLLTLRMTAEDVSPTLIGMISTAYFAGLMLGSFINSKVIMRVGHIRAYAAYASILCSLALLFGIFVAPESWMLLRLIGGFATGGLLVVIESWIIVSSPVAHRGRIMALYMVLFYAAMILGQMALKQLDIMTLLPFVFAALACSLSVLPLVLSKVSVQHLERHEKLPFFSLIRLTPTAVFSCFISGLILSVAYGLLPFFYAKSGMQIKDIADMMAYLILGGLCLQYPLGRLSDRFDRRLVLICLFSGILLVGLAFVLLDPSGNSTQAAILTLMLGGVIFAVYPISLSQACDELNPSQVVAANQGLLLCYSIGAMSGPLLAPVFIHQFGPQGIFIYFACASAICLLFLIWRRLVREPVPLEDHVAFSTSTPNTPVMAELDPRADASPLMPDDPAQDYYDKR
ncbi:MFS transporter [Bowmanella sp. Y26]|uniref:MFS transporter n=1 Tax=Bowmanella yangjiangensis TaxID=2811230 RepID=UPI001BDC94A0|nr:MFS transporter [Bowmanella yangjiangensis]MBT1064703.1 MFS transporter [Bowmanella yangjiangensis]